MRTFDWGAWLKVLLLVLVIAAVIALALATREAGMHEAVLRV
jgi:hypothetical protein